MIKCLRRQRSSCNILVSILSKSKIDYCNDPKFLDRYRWANSADPDQTAPRGAIWSGSSLFAIPFASFRRNTLWFGFFVWISGRLQQSFLASENLGTLWYYTSYVILIENVCFAYTNNCAGRSAPFLGASDKVWCLLSKPRISSHDYTCWLVSVWSCPDLRDIFHATMLIQCKLISILTGLRHDRLFVPWPHHDWGFDSNMFVNS